LQQLDAGLQSPLILVSAPAGFGKSTLLSAWVEQCAAPSAWLSLDDGDNDLVVFLRYVIAAVRTLFADACIETEALTKSVLMPSVTVLAHQFSNELDALPGDFVLVLDDYDVIHDAAVYELLSKILLRPPPPAAPCAGHAPGPCPAAGQTARKRAPHGTAPARSALYTG
jgi:LuxR family maltose regulon positive regulatory protein